MLVLGLESTCDETGCALVRNGDHILSNVVASQHDIHALYGGVFPELASRRHVDVIIPVIDQALKEAHVKLDDVDLVAVAKGPGLMGALFVGLNAAKTLAFTHRKPLIGVNHVEAHLYAALMSHEDRPLFPCIGVVLSGAHTSIVCMHDVGHYELMGQTRDDAVGEAFDKVAKMMGLPYPGGPKVEALARRGDPMRYAYKMGRIKNHRYDFSFSGIKTGVLYSINGQDCTQGPPVQEADFPDIAASFQYRAFEDILIKTLKAAEEKQCNAVIFGGGVTNNTYLRELFQEKAPHLKTYWPSRGLSLDNAAMIAGLGYHQFKKKGGDTLNLEPATRIKF